MRKIQYHKLLLALPMLLLCTRTAFASATFTAIPAVTVTYTLPATAGAAQAASLKSDQDTGVYFTVSNVPAWLTVTQYGTSGSGAVGKVAAAALSFRANAAAGAMLPGTYTQAVTFTATGGGSLAVTVTLAILAPAAQFTAVALDPTSPQWTTGNSTVRILCSSNGEPISFTAVVGGTNAASATLDHYSGIAYTWGSTITATVTQQTLQSLNVGQTIVYNVAVTPTYAGAATITIPVNINISAPAPTLAAPANLMVPKDTAADHTVVLTGTNFVASVTKVQVKVSTGGYATLDSNHAVVTSPTSMVITLDHNAYLSTAHTLNIQVSNDGTNWYPTPTARSLYVTTVPIIYSVTNSASFVQPSVGVNPVVSAYEIISIFGANFDLANGVKTNTVANPGRFPNTMNNTNGQTVTVFFCKSAVPTACVDGAGVDFLAKAPVIFVSNTQINAVVPAAVGDVAAAGANWIVVQAATDISDATNNIFPVDIAAATPGIFTPSGSGRGAGAILSSTDYSLNTSANALAHSAIALIYATGLGDPVGGTAGETYKAPGSVAAYPANCIATSDYLGILKGTTNPPTGVLRDGTDSSPVSGSSAGIGSIDGALMYTANIYGGNMPPCLDKAATGVQVLLGANATPVAPQYVGFTWDAIAGLYQINLQLPAAWTGYGTVTAPTAMPIWLVYNGTTKSQDGVTIWVKP